MESQPGQTATPAVAPRPALSAALIRFVLLTVAWGALSEGAGFWPWGLSASALVTAASLRLVPAKPGRPYTTLRLVTLIPPVLRDALLSGWDVARRAFIAGQPPLQPGLELVRLEQPDTTVAIALAYAVTLMPGTLAVEVDRRRLLVHVIDRRRDECSAIADLARRLSAARRARPG